jgi:hypothetical protein
MTVVADGKILGSTVLCDTWYQSDDICEDICMIFLIWHIAWCNINSYYCLKLWMIKNCQIKWWIVAVYVKIILSPKVYWNIDIDHVSAKIRKEKSVFHKVCDISGLGFNISNIKEVCLLLYILHILHPIYVRALFHHGSSALLGLEINSMHPDLWSRE